MPETADEGRQVVRSFVDAGYDWIKVYSFLPAEGFRGLMEEAHRLGIPVGGHVPVEVGVTNALESGLRSIEHLTEYVAHTMTPESRRADETDFRSVFHAGEIEDGALDRLIAQTVEAGVWNVPTIVWFDRNLPFSGAATAWSDRSLRKEGARNRREIVRRLYEAGAPLAVGTDSDDGFELSPSAYHDELEVLHEAGIPRGEVLRMATLGGARLLGLEGETGSIEPGKRADLLILYCDPREDLACLRTPEAGLARGRGSR